MAKKVVYPSGINRKVAVLSGGTSGQRAIATSFGVADDDVLDQVVRVTLTVESNGTSVNFSSAADITTSCDITTDGHLSVGENTTGGLLFAYFADQNPND